METVKSLPVISCSQFTSLQEKALREECAHKDSVICELHMKVGKLEHSIQQNEGTLRKLQRTEEILRLTNE